MLALVTLENLLPPNSPPIKILLKPNIIKHAKLTNINKEIEKVKLPVLTTNFDFYF
jgi:hypothetical protein